MSHYARIGTSCLLSQTKLLSQFREHASLQFRMPSGPFMNSKASQLGPRHISIKGSPLFIAQRHFSLELSRGQPLKECQGALDRLKQRHDDLKMTQAFYRSALSRPTDHPYNNSHEDLAIMENRVREIESELLQLRRDMEVITSEMDYIVSIKD